MRYMLLCYDDEEAWEKAGEAAHQQAMQEAVRLTHEIDARGQYLVASPLHPVSKATSVRVRRKKRLGNVEIRPLWELEGQPREKHRENHAASPAGTAPGVEHRKRSKRAKGESR